MAKGAGIDLANTDGVTPLSIEAAKGHASVVELLLSKGAGIDIANTDGVTPLFIAAVEGHASVVE